MVNNVHCNRATQRRWPFRILLTLSWTGRLFESNWSSTGTRPAEMIMVPPVAELMMNEMNAKKASKNS
jgi:hypothetical protein